MMTLKLLPKPSLEEFIKTCTPLARIESLEIDMRKRADEIANALLRYESTPDPLDNLTRFLKADEDFLGIALALINLSQEKFLRILLAESFAREDYETDWDKSKVHRKIKTEVGFAARIATLLLEGRDSKFLIEQIAAIYLEQLSLPSNWAEIIKDRKQIQKAILHKLAGEFSNKKGKAVEALIRNQLNDMQQKYGVTHHKGQVKLVGKEVDHTIPTLEDPYILIMTSYTETTSSSQTQRANEHRKMFLAVQDDNLRYGTKRIFINFIDGAGWLARNSDLSKMHNGCDYILNLKTLDRLEAIICKYVPKKYFTVSPRPQVEG